MNLPSSVLRFGYTILRNICPILSLSSMHVISRYDDVREVLSNSEIYQAPYKKNLKTVMGRDIPFILGMAPGNEYNEQLAILQSQILPTDIETRIPIETEDVIKQLLKNKKTINVVEVVRRATSTVLCSYFGLGEQLSNEELDQIETVALKVFKYQFMDDGEDKESQKLAAEHGATLLSIIDTKIADYRENEDNPDTLIARYLDVQRVNPSLTDDTIRAAIFGFIVGGLPQLPMVVPNALNEILNRKEIFKIAKRLVKEENTEKQFEMLVFEALRFDPLAPLLKRTAVHENKLAAGTKRAKTIRQNDQVLVLFASAMLDGRRIEAPSNFNLNRPDSAYMHFGHGHHECFAKHMNRKMIPILLKSILEKGYVIRVKGRSGKLIKRDIVFAENLELVRD